MKKYIAPGLLDLTMRVRAGDAWVTVSFTGGHSVGFNRRWASFTTNDEVMIHLIENSPEFRSGKVMEEPS